MRTKLLADVINRLEAWPAEAQDRLAEIALDIEADMSGETTIPRPRSWPASTAACAAEERRFATDEQVEEVFAKLPRV